MSNRLVFRVAQVFDGAFRAFWPQCRALRASVMNQEMSEQNPLIAGKKLHQVLLDLVRALFFCEIQPAGQSLDVRVDDNAFGLSKCHAEDHIRGLASNALQL